MEPLRGYNVDRHQGGDKLLRLYTLYAPPQHVDGIIALTRADAETLHEEFDGKTTE